MADTLSNAPTVAPSDSVSQVAPEKTAPSDGKARGRRSAKNTIAKDVPPGAVQVPKGGQNKTGKASTPQNATIQLTGWDELDLVATRTETIPTFTVDVNPYLELVTVEYDRIASRCPSAGKFIPFALFRYYCLQMWWYRVLTLMKMNGQVLTTDEKNFLNSFNNGGEDFQVPTHVAQYLANMGNFIQGGETYFFRKIVAKFTGKEMDHVVEEGWIDTGNGSSRITTGNQFWAYTQLPVPAVYATAIVNEVRTNDPSSPTLLTLEHVSPAAEDGFYWVTTDNIAGWQNNPRLYAHSSHRSTYANLGWTSYGLPTDMQTPFLFSPSSMRWMSDRLGTVRELKVYPSKQITLSSQGSPMQAYWLELPEKFYSHDYTKFVTDSEPAGKATCFSELALTSRFGVDPKAVTPAFNFGYRLARDKVISGFNANREPVYCNRSNYQPFIYCKTTEGSDDEIVNPPQQLFLGMNDSWTFGSSNNLNLNRFQTHAIRRDDAVTRSLLLINS
ncbi:putative coat protein [Beauveria bassiana partitivirus 3]|nr:putative coat protein [Beauveria bassiana partitivirus 3]